MGKKTNAAGVGAVIVALAALWVLTSGGGSSPQREAPEHAEAQPARPASLDRAELQTPVRSASGVGPVSARASHGMPDGETVQTPAPRIVPSVDWDRYPGTLNSQVQQALSGRDGVMAADLARKLRECDINSRLMQPDLLQKQVEAGGDAALVAIRNQRFQEYRRLLANCETVADWRRVMQELLDVAITQQVIGAAVESFHLGQRTPHVLQAVVHDAMAGDVQSLTPAASHRPSVFGMTSDLQRSLRYAFELSAADPEVGPLVRRYLNIAESASVPLAGEAGPHFNHDGLTDSQIAQARATAGLLVKRVKAPKDEVRKGS